MVEKLEAVLKAVLGEFKTIASTTTVVGDEFKLGEYTVIPVTRVTLGCGAGSGGRKGSDASAGEGGGGGGGGVRIDPLAFLVSRGDYISLIPIGKKRTLESLFEKVPELIEKLSAQKRKSGKENEAEDEGESKKDKKAKVN